MILWTSAIIAIAVAAGLAAVASAQVPPFNLTQGFVISSTSVP
jgi:hypothetical protein